MTEILCHWLNTELQLSRRVEPSTFAKEFSTGYLIGEILNKHQLQEDFNQFSQSRNAVSQLNNFQRMLPTLQLLGVQISESTVQGLVEEQRGVATRLLYQIYIALRRKEKAQLSKLAMETMRPLATAKLASISTKMFKERVHSMIPREVDVILENVSGQFVKIGKEIEEQARRKQEEQLQLQKTIREEQRIQHLETLHKAKKKNEELMAKIQASILPVSKSVSRGTARALQKHKQELRKKEAEMFIKEINEFETILKKLVPPGGEKEPECLVQPVATFVPCVRVDEGQAFIKIVRMRLKEDALARKKREKRRRQVMLDQLEAHETQEEVYREEQLVNRLMRQSLQERRIAVQLMHARHEKQVMVQNRIFREKQYEEKRLQEFREDLDYLADLARQEKLEHAEETRWEQEVHEWTMAARAEERFRKHYHMSWEVVEHIVDLATKIAEYRQLTLNLIPNKIMNEWKELFFNELPIYEQSVTDPQPSEQSSEDSVELAKQQLLNAQDYEDYKEMTGEWQPPEEGDIRGPPPNNNILGHVVHRIFEIVNPTKPPTPPPAFPAFPIKACILGKLHAGKSTCLKYLGEALKIHVLCPDSLVREAVQAFDEGETVDPDETQEDKTETGMENQVLDVGSLVPAGSGAASVAASEGQDTLKSPLESSTKDQYSELSKNTSKGQLTDLIEPSSQGAESFRPSPQEEVMEATQSQASVSSRKEAQPSPRAQLGARAAQLLRKGKSVPDGLLVEIVVECVRCMPAEGGWILDGFPVNIKQAKLLEKGLTGVDPDKAVTQSKMSRRKLVVDLTAPKDPPPPPPALDIAILLDVSDSTVLAHHSESTACLGTEIETQKTPSLQQETEEILAPNQSSSHEKEQLLPRLTGFLDNWPKLEKWFQARQNILVKVNGELQQDELLEKLELILVDALFKKQIKDAVPKKPAEVEKLPSPIPVVSPPSTEPQTKSPRDGRSAIVGSTKGKKGKVDQLLLEPVIEPEPPKPTTPKPGSDQWVYVDEVVPQEVAEYLAPYWNNIVDTYISTIHSVMQEQRVERHRIIHYLHKMREDYQEYLATRPDHKQTFVSQWQADYNSIPDHLRKDDDVKAELLLRLYTLRDSLWDISDNRKEEAEREKMNIIGSGWLEIHLGVLLNLYITLMQVEVDRFQDTHRFLQDYYKGMEGKLPLEDSKDFIRLPLVNIPDVVLAASASAISRESASAPDPSQPDGQIEPDPNSPPTEGKEEERGEGQGEGETKVCNAPDPSQPEEQIEPDTNSPPTEGKEEERGEEQGEGETKVCKIPLVAYRIPSSSLAAKDKGKVPLKVMAKGREKEEVVGLEAPPLTDVDEYLIFDAYQTAVSALSSIVQKEMKLKEDEEKKEQKLKEEKEKELQKPSAGKDGKKKTPKSAGNTKKGRQSISPAVLSPVIENPEVMKRRELVERIYAEYFATLEDEALAVRTRLEIIKLKAMTVVQELKSKAEEVFTVMEDGLGNRFLQEMESIDALLNIGLEHVDTASKIEHQLVLHSKEFFVNGDVKMIPDPEPLTRLPSKEIPKEGKLTIEQLQNLHRQFMLGAPTGLMTKKAFIEILQDLVTLDLGSDLLPDPWCSISYSQVLDITNSLTPDTDILDWRRFLISAAQPWPYPSLKELLETKCRFRAVDQTGSGYVTQEQYNGIELWFQGEGDIQVPEDPVEPLPFERLNKLKQVFFTIFGDVSREPPELDYNRMLLYFAAHPEPAQGFHRALSLATGTLLPWKPSSSSSSLLKSQPCIREVNREGSPVPDELVPLSALFQIITHSVIPRKDTHHLSSQHEVEQLHCKRLSKVYKELGSKSLEPVPFESLQRHPVIMDLIKSIVKFTLPDFQAILQRKPVESEVIANSSPELSVETSSTTPEDTTTRRRIGKT